MKELRIDFSKHENNMNEIAVNEKHFELVEIAKILLCL